jgi:tetratricopeptide (TPR) repeat protein
VLPPLAVAAAVGGVLLVGLVLWMRERRLRGQRERLRKTYQLGEEILGAPSAEDILQRMLTLDPGNSYVLLLKGRAAIESDDPKKAVEYLEKVADLDSHPDGMRDLLRAYLENDDLPKCAPLAEKLLTVHNDLEGLFLLAEGALDGFDVGHRRAVGHSRPQLVGVFNRGGHESSRQ